MTQGDEITEVGLVLYPGAQQAAVLGITDLFRVAQELARNGERPGGGVRITHWAVDQSEEPVRIFDSAPGRPSTPTVLILPPSLEEPESLQTAPALVRWLAARHRAGTVLGSVCAGAFVLAATGLLDGRSATTHWVHADRMARHHPAIRLETDRLVVDEGDIVTAGGLMAWTDLGLRLVERYLGPRTMIETARLLVVDPPGRAQSYYSVFSPRLTHGDATILKVQHWLHAHDAREGTVAILADMAGLQVRTFMRRFQRATGMTSTEYCQRVRVSKAREMLQFESDPIETIAWRVGYSDPAAFRKVFARIVGLAPGDYRKRFGASI